MRQFTNRILNNANYSRTIEWGKLIGLTGGAQIFVQAIGFASGIVVIRLLSTQEYALFTLANTMFGTIIILADSGIANGVLAESGKVWQDKQKLGVVIATGLALRKSFGIISLIVTLPILIYLLITHGASWAMALMIAASLIPAFFATISDALLEIAPKLHQDIKSLQRNQIEVSIGRLALNGFFLFAFPFTFIALLANGIPRIYGNYRVRIITSKFISTIEKPDHVVREGIIRGVRQSLPIVIYHCISGQLSIWLISFFGSTAGISQIGALGRLAVLFNLLGSIFSFLIIPRFSRMPAQKSALLNKFLLIQAAAITISTFILMAVYIFSDQILWVLGKDYHGLKFELLLVTLNNCIFFIIGICSQLIISRGWFIKPYFLISLNFSSTVISLIFFNVTTLTGVLYFNITVSILAYFLEFFYGLISINKISANDLA